MNIDTWAVVLATAAGPIGAVLITFWREKRAGLRWRRFEIFRTLMATRQIPIDRAHVNSLNLIEVDFYECENVLEQWLLYKAHLFNGGPEDDAWREKKERLLANMLSEMAKTLRYGIPAMDIFKGGYAPTGWVHQQSRLLGALEFVNDLATVKKAIPMWLHGTTQHPPPCQLESAQSGQKETLPPISLPPI